MIKWFAFLLLTIVLILISRKSLLAVGSHGFYRFFNWMLLGGLIILNIEFWFQEPFAWYQIISWGVLLLSFIPLFFGVRSLVTRGKPVEQREGEPQLLAFEKTSNLVTTGIYQYIRHPMYSSLLLLTLGVFFKNPSLLGGCLTVMATIFLVATAQADEKECIVYFGDRY